MYDPTIHQKSIARHVRKSDFHLNPSLRVAEELDKTLAKSVALGLSGFSTISLMTNTLRGKPVHQLANLSEMLVARHISSNIQRVTGVRQDDRHFIVSCMKQFLTQGTSFRVYKFDIASFYENVQPQYAFDRLDGDMAFSGQLIRTLRSLFAQFQEKGIAGLPRGLALSATLAEYILRDFDRMMSSETGVWFYARFVDDIAVITDGREDSVKFSQETSGKLPPGLKFNNKSTILNFLPYAKINRLVQEHGFDFLGYRFSVGVAGRDAGSNNKIGREVWLDVAPNKVRKLKTRIAKSLLAYSRSGDFELLKARFRFLTSNFTYTDIRTGARRTSGIYFNYPLVSDEKSTALLDLDNFVVKALTSRHPENRLRPKLTAPQRRSLLNLRFQTGFKEKRFFSFSTSQLSVVKECWAYA